MRYAQEIKAKKIDKQDYIKFKKFCSLRDAIDRVKRNLAE